MDNPNPDDPCKKSVGPFTKMKNIREFLTGRSSRTTSNGQKDAWASGSGPRVGQVRFGGFRRLTPISRDFGFDRGLRSTATISRSFLPKHTPSNVTGAAFYLRAVFDEVGLFERTWLSGADADLAWGMQMETDFQIRYVREALVLHRIEERCGALSAGSEVGNRQNRIIQEIPEKNGESNL